MVDVEPLWRAALGTYDLELALFVAQGAQRDPREYMPFLTELDAMTTFMQRYSIDIHLGRYDRALRNLYSAGDDQWDACLRLIRTRSLYHVALSLVADHPERLLIVRRMYAEYMTAARCHEDAALRM